MTLVERLKDFYAQKNNSREIMKIKTVFNLYLRAANVKEQKMETFFFDVIIDSIEIFCKNHV